MALSTAVLLKPRAVVIGTGTSAPLEYLTKQRRSKVSSKALTNAMAASLTNGHRQPNDPDVSRTRHKSTMRRVVSAKAPTVTSGMLASRMNVVGIRGGPRNSDRLLRWDPDRGEGVWNATEETELSG